MAQGPIGPFKRALLKEVYRETYREIMEIYPHNTPNYMPNMSKTIQTYVKILGTVRAPPEAPIIQTGETKF